MGVAARIFLCRRFKFSLTKMKEYFQKSRVELQRGNNGGDVVERIHFTTRGRTCYQKCMPRQARLDAPGTLHHIMVMRDRVDQALPK
jgi:hypothetical protein